jgi:hypothetical protein
MVRTLLKSTLGAILVLLVSPYVVSGASYDVGQHEHVAWLNAPSEGHAIPRADYVAHLEIKLHDMPVKTSYIRIDDSSNVMQKTALVLGPATDLTYDFDWTMNFGSWSVGQHELHLHLEIPNTGPTNNNKRQFTTSRLEICIVSCSPNHSGRPVWPTPFLGGGSWYGNYQNAILDTALANVTPGATITAHSQYSQSTSLCAYINPDFHHGSHGTELGCFGAGKSKHTFSLAGTAVGDNLVLISRDAHQAGVTHIKVGDGSDPDTFYFETQSWWSQSGLIIP